MKNLKSYIQKLHNTRSGFTLIELLIVVALLGVLITITIIAMDPWAQINKGRDVKRTSDLGQIRNALDVYYNDTGCYPTTLAFGQPFTNSGEIYMQEVPQDVKGTYSYIVDSSMPCPNWNVLFAVLENPTNDKPACELQELPNCIPLGSNGEDLACEVSGIADCNYISSHSL